MVLSGTLVGAGPDTDPRYQLLGRRESSSLRPDPIDDLLSCFGPDARNFDRPGDRILIILSGSIFIPSDGWQDHSGLLEDDVFDLVAAAIHEPRPVESWNIERLRCRAISNGQRP
jgi:hypothetical protein